MASSLHIALFNDARYQRQNLQPGQRLFRYDYGVGGRLIGTLSGVIVGDVLECGHSAPFGGVDFTREAVFVGATGELLRAAGERARGEGVREMLIRAAPGYFGANEVAVAFALVNLGAQVAACEVSLALEPHRYRRLDEYEANLKSSARRGLHHGLAIGGEFSAAAEAAEWAAGYELLAETRRRRGVRLSISFDYVMALREIFGRRIAMYRLRVGDKLAAAALVYRITRNRDYVVAWGDDIGFRRHSVMNVVAYELVRIALSERIDVIDLGISSVGGVADDGLIQFKRAIGGVTGLRIDFRLTLA